MDAPQMDLFPGLQLAQPPHIPSRQRRHIRRLSPEPVFLALAQVLRRQNLTFTCFVLMSAVQASPGGSIPMARLATMAGLSYDTVHKQICRTHWFRQDHSGPLITIHLTPEASEKLRHISTLLAKALRP